MILGVVSDTHNRLSNVEKIIDIFNQNNVLFIMLITHLSDAKGICDSFYNGLLPICWSIPDVYRALPMYSGMCS